MATADSAAHNDPNWEVALLVAAAADHPTIAGPPMVVGRVLDTVHYFASLEVIHRPVSCAMGSTIAIYSPYSPGRC